MSKQQTSSWVVQRCHQLTAGGVITSYWYGPDRYWSHTFGSLLDPKTHSISIGIATFSTRRDATQAAKTFGIKSCSPVRLDTAIDFELELSRKALLSKASGYTISGIRTCYKAADIERARNEIQDSWVANEDF